MNVNTSHTSLQTSNTLQTQNTISKENKSESDGQTQISARGNKINLSNFGKSISKLDSLHTEFQRFVESKVPANDLKAIDNTQEQLDRIMESGVSENSEQFKSLSKKLDQQIFEAQNKLSTEDQRYLSNLESQIDGLERGIESAMEEGENDIGQSRGISYSEGNEDYRSKILELLSGNTTNKNGSTLAQTLQAMIKKVTG